VQATLSKTLTGITLSLFPWLQVLEESLVYQMTPEIAFTPSEDPERKEEVCTSQRIKSRDCMTYIYMVHIVRGNY